MTKILTLIAACAWLSNTSTAQNFGWAKGMGNPGQDMVAGLATDPSGNVVATGFYAGTVDFDPGPGVANLSSAGSYDAFVQKLDASGNLLWAKSFGRQANDFGNAIKTDASGNIYVMGVFTDTVDFDPGPGQFKMASNNYGSYQDVFLLKLDPSGNFVWAVQRQATTSSPYALECDLELDNSNNIYMTYAFGTNTGGNRTIVEKTNSTGTPIWSKALVSSYITSTAFMEGQSIAIDGSGNVIFAGAHEGDIHLTPVGSSLTLNAISPEAFVIKLDNSGNFIWAKDLDATSIPGFSYGYDVATDNAGNVYTVGKYGGTADFDPGPGVYNVTAGAAFGYSMYLWKLTANGSLAWVNSYGSNGNDIMYAVTTDAGGNVYTTGVFETSCQFSATTPSGIISTNNYGEEIFTLKVDGQGNFDWVWHGGGSMNQDIGYAIALNNGGDVYTGGTFYGTANFDFTSGGVNLTSQGNVDAFIAKVSNCTPLNTSVTQNNNVLTSNASGVLYQWINCATGAAMPAAIGKIFTASTSGLYKVAITKSGCSDTSACYSVSTIGIGSDPQKNMSGIYPNPTNGDITIQLNETYDEVEVEITSAMGQVISKKQYNSVSSIQSLIPGAYGIYFIAVSVNGETISRTRMVKTN